jgi:phosphoribosylformylglycinamidine cyclo-ligase
LPSGLDALISTQSWEVPDLFRQLERAGNVELNEMYRTFNMGIGMVVMCAGADVESVLTSAASAGLAAKVIGSLRPGTGKVILN